MQFETANPNPEFLIKSIAEQGYSLETALADLIDNSISASADKIEILIHTNDEPFTLYLADNGSGMDEQTLKKSMEFPSGSSEGQRKESDLGRFGLGMKTASFSQTRRLTVLSRKKGQNTYSGRTWDVDHLKGKPEWEMGINSADEVATILESYTKLSKDLLNSFESFLPNTIIVWNSLYKYEAYMEEVNRRTALKKQLDEVTCDHLSLVFNRFMQKQNRPYQ